MFTLTIYGASQLQGYYILLFGPFRSGDLAVCCICYLYDTALPSVVELGSVWAYANLYPATTCQCQEAGLFSETVFIKNTLLVFNGEKFVSGGKLNDFDYGIRNSTSTRVVVGLAQSVTLNGAAAKCPIDQRFLNTNETAFIGAQKYYWLGAGNFAQDSHIDSGLVLPGELLLPTNKGMIQANCAPTLTTFTPLNIGSGHSSAEARFSIEKNAFEITNT